MLSSPAQPIPESFIGFVIKSPIARQYLGGAVLLSLASFLLLKFFFPFPDFISDSYSYIFGAKMHLDINIWPIGYSRFLALVHAVNHSDDFLVAVQYALLQLSAAYLFLSILYLYQPSKPTSRWLFLFLFVNPLFLFTSNMVNSDVLFAALSVLWLTELLWILQRPNWTHLVAAALLVFLCFTIRNNAYYYPIVNLVAFLLTKTRTAFKIAGILFPLLFIILFVIRTQDAAFRLTHKRQFSLFTGWQLANNALYGYPYLHIDSNRLRRGGIRLLDADCRAFFQKAAPDFQSFLHDYVGNYFITYSSSPLKQFFSAHYDLDTDSSMVRSWGLASALYGEYGMSLIKQAPVAYLKGFVRCNLKNYFYPPLSNFALFNRGIDETWIQAQDWFDWKTPEIRVSSKTAEAYIVMIYPVLFLFLHLYMVGALFLLAWQQKSLRLTFSTNLPYLTLLLLALNFGFILISAMNVLRYQLVPMLVLLVTDLMLAEAFGKRQQAPREIPTESSTTFLHPCQLYER